MSLPDNLDAAADPLGNASSDVLVVGGGPVGAAFALDLARRGIDVLVVDLSAEVAFDGRARSLSARTMEHLRAWGVADLFHEASPIPTTWFGETIWRQSMVGAELWRTPRAAPAVGLTAERAFRLPQNRSTALLRDAATRAGARFAYGWAATGYVEEDDAATVTVESRVGEVQQISARYVVAADGSRSEIRRAAGISRDATPLLGYRHSVIVEVPGVFETAGTYPNAFNMIVGDGFSDAFNPFEPNRYGMSIGPFAEGVQLSEELIAAEVRRRVGVALPHRTIVATSYRIQKRIAMTFRQGRLLLAGDAAHVFPPSLGMNLNMGIADAANGAWKLAAVLQGWGGEALLDSYDSERRVAAHRVGDATLRAREAIDQSVKYLRGRSIPEGSDLASVAERRRIVHEIGRLRAPVNVYDGAVFDHRYDHSEVVIADGTASSAWDSSSYVPVWRPGHRVPHHELSDGSALHALLGSGFTLLSRADPGRDVQVDVDRFVAAAAEVGMPLNHIELNDRIQGEAGPARRFSLVRPDQTLAWHAAEIPRVPSDVLRLVVGSDAAMAARSLSPRAGKPRLPLN